MELVVTKCKECGVVDLEIYRVIKNNEEYQLCPNCGSEDSAEEIDGLEWQESMALADADLQNELLKDTK